MRTRLAAKHVVHVFTACCVIAGVARTAHATNSNPNYLPFGESQSFLGNAGVARANDTGAVYYNPSGLAEIEEGSVSVSGAAYLTFHTHFDAITRADNTNIPFDYSGFSTIPSTYVATRRLGDWVGALSVLVPSSLTLDDHATFATPNVQGNLVYTLGQSELWFGLSAARELSSDWSIGITVFGIEHSQTSLIGADAQAVAAPTQVFSTSLSRVTLLNFGLAATLGVSYLATDALRFGLRAQTALVPIYGKGQSFQIERTVGGAAPTASGEDVQGPANYRMPFDFSVGTAIMPTEWMTLLVDVSLQLGTSFSTFPASASNETASFVPTPRFNLGVELTPVSDLPIRFGTYYVPSANDGHAGDANFEKEDFYGLTAGIGLNDKHVRTSVGAFYVWSTGEATPSGGTGTSASLNSRGYGVLISTAYAF